MKTGTRQKKGQNKMRLRNISFTLFIGSLILLMSWGEKYTLSQNHRRAGINYSPTIFEERDTYYTNKKVELSELKFIPTSGIKTSYPKEFKEKKSADTP